MNTHDHDHGWVDPAEGGILRQTFGAMASGVDPASPTGPAAALPEMSRRVRRRRTAKLGGLGGGALALAGALVLGAAQLAPPDQAEVLPGGPAPEFHLREAYQPPWLDGTDLTCGMPVTDLETTAPGWSVAPAGEIYGRTVDLGGAPSTTWGMAVSVDDGPGSLGTAPVLVWSRDGVVLDVGPAVHEPDLSGPVVGGGDTVEADGSAVSTCSPTSTGADPVFETPLPAGDYEVRVVAFPRLPSGGPATVVSDPVPVRLDADGAHSRAEARTAEPAPEFPEPAKGQIARFELDRTTGWHTAEMTQSGYPSDAPMLVTGQCAGSSEVAVLVELVRPSTGEVLGGTSITCDGYEAGSAVGVLDSGGEAIDIRVSGVPDGTPRLWVSVEPETPVADGTGPQCSATGFEPQFVPGNSVTGSTAATAGSIVIAATACDSEALIALANSSGTEILDGTETPEEAFALPETGTEHYRTLAALLTGTAAQIVGEGMPDATVVWPRVATTAFADSDDAWAEVVAAGLLTAEEADAQRADPDGYLGMRVSMDMSGRWTDYSTRG